jgi:hypothetical protein
MRLNPWLCAAFTAALAAPAFAAGDVAVVVDATTSTLRITGDALDNDIEITSDGTPGSYTVTGKSGTTVNLGASAAVAGVRGFAVTMGDGADRVEFTSLRIRGNVGVRLDAGEDVLVLNGVETTPRARIAVRGGDGNDRVTVQGTSEIRGPLTVLGEAGNDTVQLLNTEFLNRVRVDTGVGDDTVTVDTCQLQDRSRLEVEMRAGNDKVELLSSDFHNDVEVDLGRGEDEATLDNSNYSQDVDVSGGAGGDDDLSLRSGNDFNRNHPPGFHAFED